MLFGVSGLLLLLLLAFKSFTVSETQSKEGLLELLVHYHKIIPLPFF